MLSYRVVLPVEIWCLIFRAATVVPGALDTSYSWTLAENKQETRAAVVESLKTKLALTLVSKWARNLMLGYMYELVLLRRYNHARPLVSLLQQERGGRRLGSLVQRLDVDLGHFPDDGLEEWAYGGVSLFGLVPCCPNIEVLVCDIRSYVPPGVHCFPRHGPPKTRVPRSLFQIIARVLGQRIRRLEWNRWLIARADRVERFLACCPALEVFRLSCLDSCYFAPGVVAEPEEDSEDEDPDREYDYYDAPDRWPDLYSDDVDPRQGRDEHFAEYEAVRNSSAWPGLGTSGEKLPSPNLHTLELDAVDHSFSNWAAPALRRATIFMQEGSSLRGLERTCNLLKNTLVLCAPNITFLSFSAATLSIWPVLSKFTRLERLECYQQSDSLPEGYILMMPECALEHLARVVLHLFWTFPRDAFEAIEEHVRTNMLFVARLREAALLPSLQHVIVAWRDSPEHRPREVDFPRAALADVGVSLDYVLDDPFW
jgi:hypothetical protein